MTVLTFYVAAGGDDGHFTSGGSFQNNVSPMVTGSNDDDFHIFLRFANVTIPKGSTINSVTLNLTNQWHNNALGLCRGAAADNPAAPTTAAQGNGLSLTTANVACNYGQNSVNIKTIFDEIFGRSGWASGNAILLVIKNNGSGAGQYANYYSYEYSSTVSNLTIDFTPPPSAGEPAAITPYLLF